MRQVTDYLFGDMQEAAPSGAVSLVKSQGGSDQVGIPKSWFTDPFALLDSLGLGYKASPSGVSYATLRQMAENNVIISAIIQTRVHQVASFVRQQSNKYSTGFRISHRDKTRKLSESDINHIRDMEHFMLRCGEDWNPDRDNLETHVKKLVRDRLTYDQMCTEVVSKYNGKPHSFYAVPSYTIRIAAPKKQKGTPQRDWENKKHAKFLQIIDGIIVNAFTREEMGFSVANPRTDLRAWGYGYAELEMLIQTVTSHLWAEEWNRKAFSQGSTTKGILNIKGNIPPQQMDAFKRQWLTQVSGVANAWRTPVINSNDDIQWVSLQPTNNEMGYREWMDYLIKVACAIYLIDPAEINFDMHAGVASKPQQMSNNEAQQKISQDRGLRPLLRHVQDHFNKNVIYRIDPSYEFEFVGVDAKSEEEAIELRLKELQSYKTVNEIRELEQLPPVPHGDIVPNPSYIGYRNQKEMAEQQAQAGAGGAPGGMPMGMPGGGPEGPGGAPGGPGGVAGFPGADQRQQPGMAEKDAQGAVQAELKGKKSEKKKKHFRRLPDRYIEEPREDWESTYNAALSGDDLRKAMEPFDDLIGD